MYLIASFYVDRQSISTPGTPDMSKYTELIVRINYLVTKYGISPGHCDVSGFYIMQTENKNSILCNPLLIFCYGMPVPFPPAVRAAASAGNLSLVMPGSTQREPIHGYVQHDDLLRAPLQVRRFDKTLTEVQFFTQSIPTPSNNNTHTCPDGHDWPTEAQHAELSAG